MRFILFLISLALCTCTVQAKNMKKPKKKDR
jgi:hypothetical protein